MVGWVIVFKTVGVANDRRVLWSERARTNFLVSTSSDEVSLSQNERLKLLVSIRNKRTFSVENLF